MYNSPLLWDTITATKFVCDWNKDYIISIPTNTNIRMIIPMQLTVFNICSSKKKYYEVVYYNNKY
jgi:hypothetical protein